MQRPEISVIEQCRLLGCRATVAVQNLDDVCEEHGERVRQVSKLWRRQYGRWDAAVYLGLSSTN